MTVRVALIVFDGVELLDFAGPLELLSVAGLVPPSAPPTTSPLFGVRLLAANPTVTTANGHGYTISRDVDLLSAAGAPENYDAVLIPGGRGARAALGDEKLLDWLRRFTSPSTTEKKTVLTVCTGSLILAASGLVALGKRVSTHHAARGELRKLLDGQGEVATQRIVIEEYDWGRMMTCGGVSSGLDLALKWIEQVAGREVAETTAAWVEYEGEGWKT